MLNIQIAAVFKIGSSKEVPRIPEFLSEDAKMFLRSCLQREPCARPTATQLLEHPFVRVVEKSHSNVLSEVLKSGQKAPLRSPISPRSPRRGDMKLNTMEFGSEPGQQSSPKHESFGWWDGNMPRLQDGIISESQRARPHPLRFGTTPNQTQYTPESSPRQRSYALWDSSALLHVPIDGITLGESRTMRSPRRFQ